MTSSQQMEILETMVDDTEDVLSTYLKLAGAKILAKAFPYNPEKTEVPAQYHYLQIEIAAYLLNKRGAEGQTSHSENGISRSYESADVPPSMLRTVTPCCGVIE
jgi:hypothetical protein